jgi:hypothetical protein
MLRDRFISIAPPPVLAPAFARNPMPGKSLGGLLFFS